MNSLHGLVFRCSLFAACFSLNSYAQIYNRDSVVFVPLFNVSYSLQEPGGTLANRFGINSAVEFQFLIKTSKNWIYGVSGDFLFGNQVRENNMLDNISTPDGFLISSVGKLVDHNFTERGFTAFSKIGKLFPVWGPNPNCGITALMGLGFLEHAIHIKLVDGTDQIAPQLDSVMRKGYDRLTNGIAFYQSVGYFYLSNNRMLNFYGGLELIEGLTKERQYEYDLMEQNNAQRIDLLFGVRVGWVIPLYRRAPKEFYTY